MSGQIKYMIYVQSTKNCIALLKWIIANIDEIRQNNILIDARLVTPGDLKLLKEFGVTGLPVAYMYAPKISITPVTGIDRIKQLLITTKPRTRQSKLSGVSLYEDGALDDMYKSEFFDQNGKPISSADEDVGGSDNDRDCNLNINSMMSKYNKRMTSYTPVGPSKSNQRKPRDNVLQESDYADEDDDIGGFVDTRNSANSIDAIKSAASSINEGTQDDDILQALVDKLGD